MSNDASVFGLRSTDTNSLLRLYDQATETLRRSLHQQERAKAEKAVQRLVKELRKRNITVPGVTPTGPAHTISSPFSQP